MTREAWEIDRVSPERVVRCLHVMCAGIYEADPQRGATRFPNLLDYLRSAGLAHRLEWMTPFPAGIDCFAVEIVLLAYKALLALAQRQGLIPAAAAAESSLQALAHRANPWRRFAYIDAPKPSG